MKPDTVKGILLLLIATILFFCTSCGKKEEAAPAAAKATTISLKKTKGTVNIDDRDGKSIEPVKNLKLYSGYDLFTKETSYAWINLDQVKLAKMDEKSEIKIQKDEKRLEIHVNSGSLFFHVKEPLKDDEQMNIRTSTMAVGIRGTCGWVEKENDRHSKVYILEGTVTVQTSDGQTANVRAGQMADVTLDKKGRPKIVVPKFTKDDIPKFVRAELRRKRNRNLAEAIWEASGLNVLNPDAEEETTPEETENPEETNEEEETEATPEPEEIDFSGFYHNDNEAYDFGVGIDPNEDGTYIARWEGAGIWAQSYTGRMENNTLIITLDNGEELSLTKEGNVLTVTASDTYINTYNANGWTRFDGTYTRMNLS